MNSKPAEDAKLSVALGPQLFCSHITPTLQSTSLASKPGNASNMQLERSEHLRLQLGQGLHHKALACMVGHIPLTLAGMKLPLLSSVQSVEITAI